MRGGIRLALTAALVLSASSAIGCGITPKRSLGEQCDVNSDCNTPLACRLARCRIQCTTRRDCPLGSYCVFDSEGLGACLLDDELSCIRPSDCPLTLTCRNERCVNECEESRDCPAGNMCVADEADNRACVLVEDERCFRNSDCPEPLICAFDGRCHSECVEDRDCARGEVCIASGPGVGACGMPDEVDGGMADPDGGAGGDGGVGDPDGSVGMDGGGGRPDGATPFECTTDADCVAPNATTHCDVASTRCVVDGCTAGFGDCDLVASNGCEDDLTSPAHCGFCGNACPGAGARCASGACENPVVQLAVGEYHQCYRRMDGDVYCWGTNASGQLGVGDATNRTEPTAVMGLADAVDISAGGDHTCAIRTGGNLECWGDNNRGQIGDGTTTDKLTPTAISLPSMVTDVSAANQHTCAVLDTGEIYCWGYADDGRLGDGTDARENRTIPVRVMSSETFTQVAAADRVTCAIRSDGAVLCWGSPSRAHLGRTDTSMNRVPSLPVEDVDMALDIDNGVGFYAGHTCVLEPADRMRCWGQGVGLGYGAYFDLPYPIEPTGVGPVRDMGVGTNDTCAADASGTVYCWGFDPLLPAVAGIDRVTMLEMGGEVACALREDETLWCWTANTTTSTGRPTRVPGF